MVPFSRAGWYSCERWQESTRVLFCVKGETTIWCIHLRVCTFKLGGNQYLPHGGEASTALCLSAGPAEAIPHWNNK